MNCYFPSNQLQSLCVFCLESLVGSILKVLGVCGVGDGEVRVIPGHEAELPLCSVAITNLSVVGSDSKLLEQKSQGLGSVLFICVFPFSAGEGNGKPLQYSCLENPMDGEAWCRLLSMESQRVGHV